MPAVAEPASVCPASVALEGPARLLEPIARELISHGVALDGPRECVTVIARIEAAAGELELRIADTTGRTTVRRLRDPATVAAVIESWVRSDLVSSMFDSEHSISRSDHDHRPAAERDRYQSARSPASNRRASLPGTHTAWMAGLWAGASRAADHTIWGDLMITACVELDPFCLGGLLRGSLDFAETGESRHLDTDRASVDMLATAELPLGAEGTWSLAPGFALGAAVTDNDVDGDDKPLPGGPLHHTDVSLRLAGTLRFDVRVYRQLRLGAWFGVELTPLGRTRPLPGPPGSAIAGLPRWCARSALGLTYSSF